MSPSLGRVAIAAISRIVWLSSTGFDRYSSQGFWASSPLSLPMS